MASAPLTASDRAAFRDSLRRVSAFDDYDLAAAEAHARVLCVPARGVFLRCGDLAVHWGPSRIGAEFAVSGWTSGPAARVHHVGAPLTADLVDGRGVRAGEVIGCRHAQDRAERAPLPSPFRVLLRWLNRLP